MKKIVQIIKQYWKHLLIAAVIILVGVVIINSRTKDADEEYSIIQPTRKTIEQVLEVSGKVNAKNKATLRFLAGGKVSYLGAFEGDAVNRWQTVVSIDKRDLQKSLEQELNSFTADRIDFDQLKDDTKDIHGDKVTDRTIEKSELSLDSAALSVEMKDLALRNTSLYSPIEGILVSSPAKTAGVILSAADTFEIVDPQSLYFEVGVDESDVGKIRNGQQAQLSLDAYPEESLTSAVEYIAFQSSETQDGTVFYIRFNLPVFNDLLKYKIGMNGLASILINKKEDVLTLPITTLIQREGKSHVEILNSQNEIELKEIETGIESENEIEILSGVNESDKVIQR